MNRLEGLQGGCLRLVDTDPVHLEQMERLARMIADATGSGVRVEAFPEYRPALPGSDFVVLSFSDRNAHFRRIDCEIAARHGVRMCSGDTIGPGGVFRALREFPRILGMAQAVEELAPEAWLINYVNPSAVMGIGLMRHAGVRSFALCDSHHLPFKKLQYLRMLGEPDEAAADFDLRIAGVNHFTWILKAELRGEDVRGRIRDVFFANGREEADAGHSKARFNSRITAELADAFGAIPTCTGHTKEYVPFYQGRSPEPESVPPLALFDCDERQRVTDAMWEEVGDYVSGRRTADEFLRKYKSDHATDIIRTMVVEDGRTYFINRANAPSTEGTAAVANLPPDAFLELECRLDRSGPVPLPVGSFPCGLRALQMQILDVHELTIEAIMKKDRRLLVRALAIDPIVQSLSTAERLVSELAAAEADVLPEWVLASPSARDGGPKAAGTPIPQLY